MVRQLPREKVALAHPPNAPRCPAVIRLVPSAGPRWTPASPGPVDRAGSAVEVRLLEDRIGDAGKLLHRLRHLGGIAVEAGVDIEARQLVRDAALDLVEHGDNRV